MQEQRFKISYMTDDEWQMIKLCINTCTFRVLGIGWTGKIRWHTDFETSELVFRWE